MLQNRRSLILLLSGTLLSGTLLVDALSGSSAKAADGQAAVSTRGPVEKLQGGFQFTEGPAYASDDSDSAAGALYFSDIPANTIYVRRGDSQAEPFIQPSGHANGLFVEAGGRLVACQMDGQVVAYDVKTKQPTTLAATYEGARFNAPNDLVIDQAGGVYFTDPLFRAPEPLPQKVQAFYYISTDGKVSRVSDDLPAPNGIALSPQGDRLYLIPSRSAEMLVYDVMGPGQLSKPSVFCKLRQKQEGDNAGGDGMVVDTAGNLYITSNLGVQVFSPAGEFITLIEVPEQPANVTFGGPQRDTLYITARNGLYAVQLSTKGLPAPKLRVGE